MHCLSTKLGRNPEFGKSAIAISIFTKTSDRRDFRDLDAELGGIYHSLGSCSCRKAGARKSPKKDGFGDFFVFSWRTATTCYGNVVCDPAQCQNV